MQRILILGGGVGGTLTANLLVKKLRARIDRGEVQIIVVDATGEHVYQPGFMYIAMGGERADEPAPTGARSSGQAGRSGRRRGRADRRDRRRS